MELLLIRHGLPVRVESDRPVDPPLADLGHAQAAALAQWLVPAPVDAVVSSTMARAAQTADHVTEQFGLAATRYEDLAEMDRSSHAYIPLEELSRDHPHMQAFIADWVGPEGESLRAEFSERVLRALAHITADPPGERVAVVCHGGVINAILSHVLQLPRLLFFEPAYTSISRITYDDGRYRLHSINEAAHLRNVANTPDVEPTPRG